MLQGSIIIIVYLQLGLEVEEGLHYLLEALPALWVCALAQ